MTSVTIREESTSNSLLSTLTQAEFDWCLHPRSGYLPTGSNPPRLLDCFHWTKLPDFVRSDPEQLNHLVRRVYLPGEEIEHYVNRFIERQSSYEKTLPDHRVNRIYKTLLSLALIPQEGIERHIYDTEAGLKGERGAYDFPDVLLRIFDDFPKPPDIDFDLLFFTAPERYAKLTAVLTHELQIGRKDEEKDFAAFPPRKLHFEWADTQPRMLNAPRWYVAGEKDRLPQITEAAVQRTLRFYEIAEAGDDWEAYADREQRLMDGVGGLKYHYSNPKFAGRPWLYKDPSATFATKTTPKILTPAKIAEAYRVSFHANAPIIRPRFWKALKNSVTRVLELSGKPIVQPWKHTVSNLRCKTCGAVNRNKYPILSGHLHATSKKKKCHVDPETRLCNRKECIRSREIRNEFDAQRLHAGYPEHPGYFFGGPKGLYKTPPELMRWACSDERSVRDANLDCSERYMYPKSKRTKTDKDNYLTKEEGGTEPAKPPGRPEIDGTVVLSPLGERVYQAKKNCEEIALKQFGIPTDVRISSLWRGFEHGSLDYKPGQLVIVPEPAEEYVTPNCNCFGESSTESTEEKVKQALTEKEKQEKQERISREEKDFKPSWELDALDEIMSEKDDAIGLDESPFTNRWVIPAGGTKERHGPPYPIVRAFIIRGTAPYRIAEFRDPLVTKAMEVLWESKLRCKIEESISDKDQDFPNYQKTPLKYIANPNRVGKEFFATVRQTTGAEDEIHQQQLAALERIEANQTLTKAQKEKARWIRDILDGVQNVSDVAKLQNRGKEEVQSDMSAFLRMKAEDLKPDRQWSLALLKQRKELVDGFYVLVKLPRCATKPYLLLRWNDCDLSNTEATQRQLENALESAVCDVIQQRIKNKNIDGDCKECRGVPGKHHVCPQCEKRLLVDAREVYDEFNRLPWRARVNRKWYDEFGREIA